MFLERLLANVIGAFPYVSTGHLPPSSDVDRLLASAFDLFNGDAEGECSQVYPALARVDPDLFGISVVSTDGHVHSIGATDHAFTIMSVSKPFVFALVCQIIGATGMQEKIGVNATGFAFNALSPVELSSDGRTNPMVNPGAIATTSLVPGANADAKWRFIHKGLSRFAGRDLAMNVEVLQSARDTNFRNRGIAHLLQSLGRMYCDPMEALDLYTMQCSLDINAVDLAVMGATLADGGVNPITRELVIDPKICHHTLAVMTIAGLYENSGDWLYEIGLPGKSGIGGGIVTVSPGKGGLGTFGPRLDGAGNSVKGQLATKYLSEQLGMDLLVSKPFAADQD